MDRHAFLYQEAPKGYVAGVGRGATGFVTAADSGALLAVADDDNDADDSAISTIDKDDEADRVYSEVEKRLQLRRKQAAVVETENNDVKSKFLDLKRALSAVTDDQWASIPEAGDLTRRNKRLRLLEQARQRFYATPDSVLASAGGQTAANSPTNFESLSQTRDKLLGAQLDSLVPTQETAITEELIEDTAEADRRLADVQKNRTILASLRKADPHNAFSWISSANLELQAKNFKAAKRLITEGCNKVPHNEEIWLENIKIHRNAADGARTCKLIVTEALRCNSKSERLWLAACELENAADIVSQRRVLMKGIEFVPNSVVLWKKLIELEENEEDVKKLLSKAIELCPGEWDFWLTLINLSPYEDAKALLNRARKSIESSQVWTVASKLEERQKDSITSEKLAKLIEKGVQQLDDSMSRRKWLEEAAVAEDEKFTKTCRAIVISVMGLGDEEDRLQVCFDEAKFFHDNSHMDTSNFIYQYAIDKYPNNIEVWVKFFGAIKAQKDLQLDTLYRYYQQAIDLNPNECLFHLMYAKDAWKIGNNVNKARDILVRATEKLPDEESLWHARIKLEVKSESYEKALKISNDMIKTLPTKSASVWYKHIHLVRCLNTVGLIDDYEKTVSDFIAKALRHFPDNDKLYLQQSQVLLNDLGKKDEAKEALLVGTNKISNSVDLWIHLARMEEQVFKVLIRARSILDKAVFKNPNSDQLWEEKIRLERRHNDLIVARQLCNRALKTFKHSPRLWIQYLTLIQKMSQRKNGFLDALRETNNSPLILLNIGIFFWADGKISKAKSWFQRSFEADKTNGDTWGWLYNFFKQHGSEKDLDSLVQHFEEQQDDITKGETWNEVSKAIHNFNKAPTEVLSLVATTLKSKSL